MRCSGCGKDIPFGGEVCPFCQRDKSSDQTSTVVGTIAMIVGGSIGSLIGGFGGMIVGALILGVVALIMTMPGKHHSAKKPPAVRAIKSDISGKTMPMPLASAADRIATLNALKAQGLVTEKEYVDQRAAIISAL